MPFPAARKGADQHAHGAVPVDRFGVDWVPLSSGDMEPQRATPLSILEVGTQQYTEKRAFRVGCWVGGSALGATGVSPVLLLYAPCEFLTRPPLCEVPARVIWCPYSRARAFKVFAFGMLEWRMTGKPSLKKSTGETPVAPNLPSPKILNGVDQQGATLGADGHVMAIESFHLTNVG